MFGGGRFQVAPDNRAKCKATGEKIEKGSLRLCARVASNDELASGAEKSKSFFKVPALADFLRRLAPWTTPAAIAGYASLEPDDRATVDAAFAAPVTVAGVAFQANLDAAFAAYDAAAPPLSPPSFAAHDAAPPVSPPS